MNAARREIAAERGIDQVRGIGFQDDGGKAELALMDRLRGVADPEADLAHVLAVAIADARATVNGDPLRWLGWSICEPKAWRAKLMATPTGARRAAQSSRPANVMDALDEAADELSAGAE